MDYNSGPYTVQFDVGITRVSFTVPVINDDILENNERFNLNINGSTLPESVAVGDLGQTTVTIVANDSKYTCKATGSASMRVSYRARSNGLVSSYYPMMTPGK